MVQMVRVALVALRLSVPLGQDRPRLLPRIATETDGTMASPWNTQGIFGTMSPRVCKLAPFRIWRPRARACARPAPDAGTRAAGCSRELPLWQPQRWRAGAGGRWSRAPVRRALVRRRGGRLWVDGVEQPRPVAVARRPVDRGVVQAGVHAARQLRRHAKQLPGPSRKLQRPPRQLPGGPARARAGDAARAARVLGRRALARRVARGGRALRRRHPNPTHAHGRARRGHGPA
jgi:hypothetical protein